MNRRYIATQLRRLARWVDRGPIERIERDILPDDLVMIFRGTDPTAPTGWTTHYSDEHCCVAYVTAGDSDRVC